MQFNKDIIGLYFLLIIFCAISCRNKTATLCHEDGGECVTIKDNNNTRFIYFDTEKKLNFVKLDISKVDLDGDGIFICWDSRNNKILLVNPNTTVLQESYDTNYYNFRNKLPSDSEGMPNALIFHMTGCCEYNISSNSIFPKNNGVIFKP